VRRVIPLWISIPWWFAAMAILFCWEFSQRRDALGSELAWLPMMLWVLFADRMRNPEKSYPRWK
jgi:hypothetical protein